MLAVSSLHVSYGKVSVLRGLDLAVGPGEILALLGPNGSGKTTAVRAIAGLVASTGSIQLGGEEISKASVRSRVRRGITLVPQGHNVFGSMTVLENLRLGAYARRDEIGDDLDRWLDFFPGLREMQHRLGSKLSGGQRQMVAVASGMMARPTVILLDEPSLGVAPIVLRELGETLRRIRGELGLAVVLVEQDVPFALSVADRVDVLSGGRVALSDDAANLRDDDRLHGIYFGHGETAGSS